MPTGQALYRRWISRVGQGRGPEGPVSFTGNDILRLDGDGERFAEYWTGTSTG